MSDTNIDPGTPGLPRPVQVGTATYLDPDGVPHQVPVYEPSAATNGERIQAEDVGEGWVLVGEEPLPAPQPTAEDRIAAAAAALASIDTLAAPVLPVDVLDVLTDVRTALEG